MVFKNIVDNRKYLFYNYTFTPKSSNNYVLYTFKILY